MPQNYFYNSPQRYLLIRTDRIGDTILTLPSVTTIRKRYPKAFIAFLSKPYTNSLVKQYSGIDLLLTYEPEGRHKGLKGILKLSEELKEYKFHSAILFYPRVELAFAIFRAKNRKIAQPINLLGNSNLFRIFLLTNRTQNLR